MTILVFIIKRDNLTFELFSIIWYSNTILYCFLLPFKFIKYNKNSKLELSWMEEEFLPMESRGWNIWFCFQQLESWELELLHRLKSQSLKRLPVLISHRFNISSQAASGVIGHKCSWGLGATICLSWLWQIWSEPLLLMIETSVGSH